MRKRGWYLTKVYFPDTGAIECPGIGQHGGQEQTQTIEIQKQKENLALPHGL